MSDPVTLNLMILARIEDDASVKIVPIGDRVPKVLKMWMNRDATFFLAQAAVNSLFAMPRTADAAFVVTLPVNVVRAGQEPGLADPVATDGSRIIRPNLMVVPDVEGKS
jgi:hypothetical protein